MRLTYYIVPLILLAGLLALPAPTIPAEPPAALKAPAADPLVGVWAFETTDGTNPLAGTVSVWKTGDVFAVHWSGAAETEEGLALVLMSGHGMRCGNTLAISWQSGKSHGLSVFTIADKELRGSWTPAGSAKAREEVWTWVGKHRKGV